MSEIRLNEKQLEAVTHKSGPLMIIAGAGTGKTSVITKRILYLIEEGLALPDQILALTFTEKAAHEMLVRVDDGLKIGSAEPFISTFHSFCDHVLRQSGLYIGIDPSYTLMSQTESYIFFRKHLFTFSLERFRPLGNPTSFIAELLKHFSRLQDEDISPSQYMEYAQALGETSQEDRESKLDSLELAKVFEEYSNLKVKNSRLDFGDLITLTLKLFRERPEILRQYQNRFKYILVDEYQDSNYTQSVLVNTLLLGDKYDSASKKARKEANITVVGDDDQSIYRFRGAAISNILQFKEVYPECKRVVLVDNYRSRGEILEGAYKLIQNNNPERLEVREKIDKRLIPHFQPSRESKEHPIQFKALDDAVGEGEYVAKEILELTGNKERLVNDSQIVDKKYDNRGQGMFVDVAENIQNPYKFSDIAILVRAHSHTGSIIEAFKRYGVPYKFLGERGLYTRPEVGVLISFLKVLTDHEDDISMFDLLKMKIWDLTSREIVELMALRKREKKSIFNVLEELWGVKLGQDREDAEALPEPKSKNLLNAMFSPETVSRLADLMLILDHSTRMVTNGEMIGEILYFFFKSSGYLDRLVKEESNENLFIVQNISRYFELVAQYESDNKSSNLYEYLDFLQYSIESGDVPKVDSDLLEQYDAVSIMTVHGAKGLEFPIVFISSLVTDRFPSRSRSEKIPIPEALIKELGVSHSNENLPEERRLFYVGMTRAKELLYLTASRFYGEGKRLTRPSIFLQEALGDEVLADFEPENKGRMKDLTTISLASYDEAVDINGLNVHIPEKVSYSHLDTYEKCPLQYKYRYVLSIPGKPSSTLTFGRVVHNTLKEFYEAHQRYYEGLGLGDEPTLETLLGLYEKNWSGFGFESAKHEELRREFGRSALTQYFENLYDSTQKPLHLERRFNYKIGESVLNGAIDRIDLVSGEMVDLIDYKTGKYKDDKNVPLQLAIYAMVATRLWGYKVRKASLIFVEHGKQVDYTVDQEVFDQTEGEIDQVVKLIRSGDFTPKPSQHVCGYCDYNTICPAAVV